ncbi:MAG: D-hexose-6-phosphate mutarotase, partial [Kangiellaceae bacterium]|nr:D-hexose-6-phosphate mutarotase [Kangiellaceae bacterium]
MQRSLSHLKEKFNFPDIIQFERQGELIKCLVNFKYAKAEFFLQGAHITSFIPKHLNTDMLWLSPQSNYSMGKAIRGGIPICWPWFGKSKTDASLPQHGFARNSEFSLDSIEISDETVTIKLLLISNRESLKLWPHNFKLEVEFKFGKRLEVSLTTVNDDALPFSITEAIHSYFLISDINKTAIRGLANIDYFDQLTSHSKAQQDDLEFNQEVDRIYSASKEPLEISQQNKVKVEITQVGANSTVIWNPWQNKAQAMSDFPDSGYLT